MIRRWFRVGDAVMEVEGRVEEGHVHLHSPEEGSWAFHQDGVRIRLRDPSHRYHEVWIVAEGTTLWVAFQGRVWRVEALPPASSRESPDAHPPEIRSPLTGKVRKVHVREGESVEAESVLVTVEAMKMEYHLTAPAPAVVEEVRVREGDLVDLGQVLLRLSYPSLNQAEPRGE